jgi:hypothetical protein
MRGSDAPTLKKTITYTVLTAREQGARKVFMRLRTY